MAQRIADAREVPLSLPRSNGALAGRSSPAIRTATPSIPPPGAVVAYRDDGIVIATQATAGMTRTQHSVGQLMVGGAADVPAHEPTPWCDLRAPPAICVTQP